MNNTPSSIRYAEIFPALPISRKDRHMIYSFLDSCDCFALHSQNSFTYSEPGNTKLFSSFIVQLLKHPNFKCCVSICQQEILLEEAGGRKKKQVCTIEPAAQLPNAKVRSKQQGQKCNNFCISGEWMMDKATCLQSTLLYLSSKLAGCFACKLHDPK